MCFVFCIPNTVFHFVCVSVVLEYRRTNHRLMVLLIMSSLEVTSRVDKKEGQNLNPNLDIMYVFHYPKWPSVAQNSKYGSIGDLKKNISTLMPVVGTWNSTHTSRQLSPKDSQVIYLLHFIWFHMETFCSLILEIFMNSQTHLIFFACERDVVQIIECYTSRFCSASISTAPVD